MHFGFWCIAVSPLHARRRWNTIGFSSENRIFVSKSPAQGDTSSVFVIWIYNVFGWREMCAQRTVDFFSPLFVSTRTQFTYYYVECMRSYVNWRARISIQSHEFSRGDFHTAFALQQRFAFNCFLPRTHTPVYRYFRLTAQSIPSTKSYTPFQIE